MCFKGGFGVVRWVEVCCYVMWYSVFELASVILAEKWRGIV